MANKILLITLKAEIAGALQKAFTGAGYELDIALSGKEGIARSVSGKPALVLFHGTDSPSDAYVKQFRGQAPTASIPLVQVNDAQLDSPDSLLQLTRRAFVPHRVLVAEDDRQMAEILKVLLSRNNYEVKTAYDGAETLKEVRAWKPHLIVLDIMLPVIDGFHVCQTMSEDHTINPRPKVLIISGRGSEWDQQLGAACGAEDYIVKPFSNSSFLDKVNEIFAKL
jgi:DNA-binding response OmpR family regulator